MAIIALAVFARGQIQTTAWTSPSILCFVLSAIPWIQFALGQIVFAGTAWLACLYLLGLGLALRTGAIWETTQSGELARYLLSAIVFAALLSTGLAIYQWLKLDFLDVWGIEVVGSRPYANLGQPNQLATFLSWGLIGLTWLWTKRYIRSQILVLAVCFLLFGIALTSSRTAWLVLAAFGGLFFYWRKWLLTFRPLFVLGALALFFILLNLVIPEIALSLLLPSDGGMQPDELQARFASEARPLIWSAFIDAAQRSPWGGYGWNQVGVAQLKVLLEYPRLNVFFSHSHNLFLDLVLWMGIPLGLGVSLFLIWRFWRLWRTVRSSDDALLYCLLLAVAIHAMLELPLHYAYMLLPAGLAWGALESKQLGWSVKSFQRSFHLGLWLVSTALLAGVIKDYLNVQTSFWWLRYEWARLATRGSAPVPEVVFLTQWREFVRLHHLELNSPPSPEMMKIIKNQAYLYPSSGFLMKLAGSFALNGQFDEAQRSLQQACQLNGERQCAAIRSTWMHEAQRFPALSLVKLP